MRFIEVFAFIIMPMLVLAIGVGGSWLHMRDLKRREDHPIE